MDKYTEKIALYMEDMLTETEAAELETHLVSCPVCQAEYAALKQIDQLLMSMPMAVPPVNFVAQVEMRLERRVNRRRSLAGTAIISVILLIAIGLLAWSAADFSVTVLNFTNSFSLLGNVTGLLSATLAGLGTLLKVVVLVAQAMLQIARHPAFWGYVTLTVGVISFWTQLLRRINLAQQTVRVEYVS